MNDIDKAKKIFSEGSFTCVLCKGEAVYTSTLSGIAPMVDFIGKKTDLIGFSAADKIIGKAAAMLFTLVGVKTVYAEVISKDAVEFLKSSGISCDYKTLTDKIVNRSGTGPCPMEQAVCGINSPAEALAAIKNTLERLRRD